METKEYWNLNLHWVTEKMKAERLTRAPTHRICPINRQKMALVRCDLQSHLFVL